MGYFLSSYAVPFAVLGVFGLVLSGRAEPGRRYLVRLAGLLLVVYPLVRFGWLGDQPLTVLVPGSEGYGSYDALLVGSAVVQTAPLAGALLLLLVAVTRAGRRAPASGEPPESEEPRESAPSASARASQAPPDGSAP